MEEYKTLITLETVQHMEDASNQCVECMLNHFAKIRKCSEEEFGQTRRV